MPPPTNPIASVLTAQTTDSLCSFSRFTNRAPRRAADGPACPGLLAAAFSRAIFGSSLRHHVIQTLALHCCPTGDLVLGLDPHLQKLGAFRRVGETPDRPAAGNSGPNYPAQEAYTAQALRDGGFVTGGDATGTQTGRMTSARWAAEYEQLKSLGILEGPLDPTATYSLQFAQ